jgi:ankyrin repeat protein
MQTTLFDTCWYSQSFLNDTVHQRRKMNCGNYYDKKNQLIDYCENLQWSAVISRLMTHPLEAKYRNEDDGRTALHVACSNHANAVVTLVLCVANPGAIDALDSMKMTPLHCACNILNPDAEVVNLLLGIGTTTGERIHRFSMQTVDGDTPLHAACRVGASMEVLEALMRACPRALLKRDRENLTPLQRVWVRFVFLRGGETTHPTVVIHSVVQAATWTKILLFLKYMAMMIQGSVIKVGDSAGFNVIHAIVANDCPRDILRVALHLFPEQLLQQDALGQNALDLAICMPTFKVRDWAYEGGRLFPLDHGDEIMVEGRGNCDPNVIQKPCGGQCLEPSVVETLLAASQGRTLYESSKIYSNSMRTHPLLRALRCGKSWTDGVGVLVDMETSALSLQDRFSLMSPFMVAAVYCKTPATCVTTVYELLRRSPEQIMHFSKRTRYTGALLPSKKRESSFHTPVGDVRFNIAPVKKKRESKRA